MKIILEKTEEIVPVEGVPTRLWKGKTNGGVEIVAFIARIGVSRLSDSAQLERELIETTHRETEGSPMVEATARVL